MTSALKPFVSLVSLRTKSSPRLSWTETMINRNRPNFKVVVNAPKMTRGIFYHPVTCRQLAVLSYTSPFKGYRLSIPIEGMNGWHVVMPTFWKAERVASREMTRFGKLYNRTIFMVAALLFYKLH